MPDSSRSCGELIAPPHRITSRRARTVWDRLSCMNCNPGRALALERDPLRQRAGDHPQVRPVHHRMQIALGGRATLAVDRGGLVVADAFLVGAVEIRIGRIAEVVAGTDERLGDLVLVGYVGHHQRAAGAVPRIGSAHLVLGALEIGQHVGGGPSRAAHLPPQVEILVLAADVDHAVDRGRPAQHFAARPEDAPSVGAGIWFGLVTPVHRGVGEGLAEAQRDVDPAVVVVPAGLQQHDAGGGVLAQPRRHDATRGAGADHDEVRFDYLGHCSLSPPSRRVMAVPGLDPGIGPAMTRGSSPSAMAIPHSLRTRPGRRPSA